MAACEACQVACLDEARRPRRATNDTGPGLLTVVLARENPLRAMKQVRANKETAGVDGLNIDQTADLLQTQWPAIRDSLLKGTYRPRPVRRVMIPKPGGGGRELGILQFSQLWLSTGPRCPRGCSGGTILRAVRTADSCGCGSGEILRPSRSRHPDRPPAPKNSRPRYRPTGPDLLERRYRRWETAIARTMGTPQGGPLSPLLANLLLDEVDKEAGTAGPCLLPLCR